MIRIGLPRLLKCPFQKKANELQQILMASQWMSRSIPNYNNLVVNLQDILEKAMKMQPRRSKKVASRVNLFHLAGDIRINDFRKL